MVVLEQHLEDLAEDTRAHPFLKALVNAGARAELIGNRLPLAPRSKPVGNTGNRASVVEAGAASSALPLRRLGNERLDLLPKFVVDVPEFGFYSALGSRS